MNARENDIGELEEDDRDRFSEVLGDIGIIGRQTLDETVPLLAQ